MQCAIPDSNSLLEAERKSLSDPFIHEETKPHLDSLDSADEFSLEHLLAVYRLVEIEDYELDGYVFDDTCLHVA